LNARLKSAQLFGLDLRANVIDAGRKRDTNSVAETPLYRLGSRLNCKKSLLLAGIAAIRAIPVTVIRQGSPARACHAPVRDFMQRAPDKILSEEDAVGLTRHVVRLIRTALQHGPVRLLKGGVKKAYELRYHKGAGADTHFSPWDF
tara:strand:+ start:90 stop:527 length:438 start_codon:yes stop_codon:yes gene_type:complete